MSGDPAQSQNLPGDYSRTCAESRNSETGPIADDQSSRLCLLVKTMTIVRMIATNGSTIAIVFGSIGGPPENRYSTNELLRMGINQSVDREIVSAGKRRNFPIAQAVIAGFFYHEFHSLLLGKRHHVLHQVSERTMPDRFCGI